MFLRNLYLKMCFVLITVSLTILKYRYFLRSYIIRNSASESYLDSNQKHKYKFYQNSEDTFFGKKQNELSQNTSLICELLAGMSDQIGLGVMPRNARVPPVVANIAELRRSLMGQGREA